MKGLQALCFQALPCSVPRRGSDLLTPSLWCVVPSLSCARTGPSVRLHVLQQKLVCRETIPKEKKKLSIINGIYEEDNSVGSHANQSLW